MRNDERFLKSREDRGPEDLAASVTECSVYQSTRAYSSTRLWIIKCVWLIDA